MSDQRSMKDGPFFWANKHALEKIRNRCEDAKIALSIYIALCEIASDEQSDNFMVSMHKIGEKACLSRRAVIKHIGSLETIGLVEITRSRTSENFRVPSAYQLLRCESAAQRSASRSHRCASEV